MVHSSLGLTAIDAPKDCTFANLIRTQPISVCFTQSGAGTLRTPARGGVPAYRNAAIIRVIGPI